MSEDMPSWRSLASAASRSIKGYVAQRDPRKVVAIPTESATRNGQPANVYAKQSWGQWAGQKIRDIRQPGDEGSVTAIEKLSLFPGWAARRYRQPDLKNFEDAEFDIEVFVSGYASRFSGPGFGTRSGKAFLRIAKSYAALPKLVNGGPSTVVEESAEVEDHLTRSADELLASKHLPPRPDEITEETELSVLEEQLRQLDYETESVGTDSSVSCDSSQHSSGSSTQSHSESQTSQGSTPPDSAFSNLQKWHSNLERRLYPFWASALSNRTLRISLYSSDPSLYESVQSPPLHALDDDEHALHRRPVITKEVSTSADGSFQARFLLDWESICQHPGALHIAFGDHGLEHDLFVSTQLMPAPSRPSTPTSAGPTSAQYFTRPSRILSPTVTATLSIPLTHTTIRVISDIDDTVKLSGIVQGARAAFRNVFVKDLDESIIPGMADWYISMWRRGVRFHYVSNGPFELLPVVSEFIQLSRLPPGSVKLKSYAGRSLFNGLLSAPAERKRAGIIDVLDSFPDSQFFLVGDSGEQDMELYAVLARERPTQILAIFIRDANNGSLVKPLEDPTGEQVLKSSADECFAVNGNGGSRNPLSVIIPKPGSVASTPSNSPKLNGVVDFTPRRQPARSISEMATPRASAAPRYKVARKPSRTQSEQISPSEASLFPTQNGSGSSSGSSSLLPSPYPYPGPGSGPGSGSYLRQPSPITDSPICEDEPGPLPPPLLAAPTPARAPLSSTSSYPPPPTSQTRPQAYFSRSPSRSSTLGSMMGGQPAMTDAERKQFDLQTRVYRARLEVPRHIPLRVFRSPEECVEAGKVLDQLHLGQTQTSL